MSKPLGMAESDAPFDAPPLSAQANLGPDGRLLIPKALREAAGIKPGDKVTLQVEEGRIIVSSFRAELKRLNGIFAHLKKPGENVVDEFLAERRAMWGEDE